MSPDQIPEPAEARPEQTIAQTAETLWQLPFTVFAAWCNVMIPPSPAGQSHHPHRDEHEQLVVPEPLEEASERALFA